MLRGLAKVAEYQHIPKKKYRNEIIVGVLVFVFLIFRYELKPIL
ncbi:MAG: hypothetical protein ACK5VF_07200 [Bacteroidota bacterium]